MTNQKRCPNCGVYIGSKGHTCRKNRPRDENGRFAPEAPKR